ncbi:hypothetical protein [Arthrobacter sp. H20]|uniref:hypothetical protein n=1 Tax=Arthrobacter sp. H20 TaxID=1267981 RepID=UPI000479007E|nr:hypothetical protein [Arthrobacter sp. H20]
MAIVDRTGTGQNDLNRHLRVLGVEIVHLDPANFTVMPDRNLEYRSRPLPDIDAVLWRLPSETYPAMEGIARHFEGNGILVANPLPALETAANQRDTMLRFYVAGLRTQPSFGIYPGCTVPAGMTARPASGPGEPVTGVRLAPAVSVPKDSCAPWIMSATVDPFDVVRQLVVDGRVVCIYLMNPRRSYFQPSETQTQAAVAAAEACDALIASVSSTPAGEIIGLDPAPVIPAEFAEAVAADLLIGLTRLLRERDEGATQLRPPALRLVR